MAGNWKILRKSACVNDHGNYVYEYLDVGAEAELEGDNTSDVSKSWTIGRRIVEWNILSEGMYCCTLQVSTSPVRYCRRTIVWARWSTDGIKVYQMGNHSKSEGLKVELNNLVTKMIGRSNSLNDLGSTQSNESFNQLVSVKAPKSRHYGGSCSLQNRLSAAVLQKNEGYGYLSKINEAANLSPG
ncbi:Hypothetical predicted protein [Mytilus galloprovincialis]|uniref:Uncharacterized protein n=1 Tax=Mytilus galloprovincialis TaxID=29158 RepID=A0A8B6CDT8_MYTGA|nr:Hypothetical predicted protein [Mytilus galloprovincialis]